MPKETIPRASNFVPETIVAGGLVDRIGRGTNQIQAAFGFEFFNSLNTTVVVMTRTGVKYHIPPMAGASFKGFVVRTNYRVVAGVNVDTHDLWNDSGHATTAEAELIAKVVSRDDTVVKAGRYPHAGLVDYVVQYSDFEDYGGSVYLSNLDLTLSILPIEDAPPHPYSLVGMRQSVAAEVEELVERKGLTYQIRIVDRLGRFGDRYVNLGGEVFQIRAERNCEDMQCGVYAVSNYPANGDQSLPQARSRYFKFEDVAKELHLYLTFNEAKTLGNPQDIYKRDLDERAHQQKLREQDWAREKADWQRESDERKQQMERETHEAKMRLLDREDRVRQREENAARQEQENRVLEQRIRRDQLILKEAYDNRSHDRKEVQEILKHLPMLIGGIGAIYIAIKKLKG